jgi:hypothetical protein
MSPDFPDKSDISRLDPRYYDPRYSIDSYIRSIGIKRVRVKDQVKRGALAFAFFRTTLSKSHRWIQFASAPP